MSSAADYVNDSLLAPHNIKQNLIQNAQQFGMHSKRYTWRHDTIFYGTYTVYQSQLEVL